MFAVGTSTDFVVAESTVRGTTAENYFLEASLDRYAAAAGGQPVGTALVPVRKGDRELAVSFVLNIAPKKPAPAPTGAQ